MKNTTEISFYVNSQQEEAAIVSPEGGEFAGQHVLVLYDDPPMRTPAPMLLDKGTKRWLLDWLQADEDGDDA